MSSVAAGGVERQAMGQVLRDASCRRLLWVNGGLFVLLAVLFSLPAGAQNSTPGARARGEYTMISGKTSVGGNSAVYILDSVNQEMIALRWDAGRKSFIGLGYRSLDTDSKLQPGR